MYTGDTSSVGGSTSTSVGGQALVFEHVLLKDAFLLLRSLCKLSMMKRDDRDDMQDPR